MSNVAGKAYAMNVITPIKSCMAWVNKLIFWLAIKFPGALTGLLTLSLIHYARWVIIKDCEFPHLAKEQPKEKLHYTYMLFFSNFNGSWDQYVDSFTFAIPGGLDLFWKWNIRYPKSVTLTPFHKYIHYNQIETIHYYDAYPLAASNDVKGAKVVKTALTQFDRDTQNVSDEEFMTRYKALLRALQHDLGDMYPTPIVTMAAHEVQERKLKHAVEQAALAGGQNG